jgi:hypothetical protein
MYAAAYKSCSVGYRVVARRETILDLHVASSHIAACTNEIEADLETHSHRGILNMLLAYSAAERTRYVVGSGKLLCFYD